MTTGIRSDLVILVILCLLAGPLTAQTAIPVTGSRVEELEALDFLVTEVMTRHGIEGGALAVSYDERLVYARGFGWADREAGRVVVPDSLFRIASISKPITAVAILRLVQNGQLHLEDKAFTILSDLLPANGVVADPRVFDITIRHLLHHAGGWDRAIAGDPMFMPATIANAMGVEAPPGPDTIIRYMLGRNLQFPPGGRESYSNFGYSVLGRVIERITGMPYDEYVKMNVLAPAGIDCMQIGRTRIEDAGPREVRYYDPDLVFSVFADVVGRVPEPYGGFYLEAFDSHGGWIASAIDLLRFVGSVDGANRRPDLLDAVHLDLMLEEPPYPYHTFPFRYYALGWDVARFSGDRAWSHTGALPGTRTLLTGTSLGISVAALFNTWPSEEFFEELQVGLNEILLGQIEWPEHDWFGVYGRCSVPRVRGVHR